MATIDLSVIGELFERVQIEQVYPDGKTFVDCTANAPLAGIIESYNALKNSKGFSLEDFVHDNFTEPPAISSTFKSDTTRSAEEHIMLLWDELKRNPEESDSSLIALPHPYIVPGGRFREIFYWDSYFTMLGLKESGKVEMIKNMIGNFAFLIDQLGYIPNGNRSYFTGRSQPPFFAAMVELLADMEGDKILEQYLPQLLKEYQFWMRGAEELTVSQNNISRVVKMQDGSIMNRYYDDNATPRPESYREDIELGEHSTDKKLLFRNIRAACESGWDFSSRWFKTADDFSTIHTTEIIPVDLNCLLCNLELVISKSFLSLEDLINAGMYKTYAENRLKAISKYCWNDEEVFYFDYDFAAGSQKTSVTAAGAFPLYFRLADASQAAAVALKLQNHLLKPAGIVTTSIETGQQWDSPNGWAPLQWIAAAGLKNYDHMQLADEIARRWTKINETVYKSTGKMMEKYNVCDLGKEAGGGEYPAQDGFGWTNAVYLAFKNWNRP